MTAQLFPTYEVGSLPKLNARMNRFRQKEVSNNDIAEVKYFAQRAGLRGADTEYVLKILQGEQKLPKEERRAVIDFNALLYLKLQEKCGLDYVYEGEARRSEMYRHVARQVDGFENLPEMIRSRGPDSWQTSVCITEPQLKENALGKLVLDEFVFAKHHAVHPLKVPLDDPYMIAVMSDNRFYKDLLQKEYQGKRLRYEAKRQLNLALARNVIRPQVEAVVEQGARWIQLDAPAATLDLEHIPILVEGLNAVVSGINDVKFSVHICYPRRKTLMEKQGYELLFPHVLELEKTIDHFSLELANEDKITKDLAVFRQYADQRKFEIGVGVVDITLEKQQQGTLETVEDVKRRICEAAEVLGDEKLVYVAPDCGLRQLSLERCERIYDVVVEGAELARQG